MAQFQGSRGVTHHLIWMGNYRTMSSIPFAVEGLVLMVLLKLQKQHEVGLIFGSSLVKNDSSVCGTARIRKREEQWGPLLRVQGISLCL